jgi:hypothetical protein
MQLVILIPKFYNENSEFRRCHAEEASRSEEEEVLAGRVPRVRV